jgi:hypothetical protein
MKKTSPRALSIALSRAARHVLVNNLASPNYGAHTTPGPRQTAILATIAASKASRTGRRALEPSEVAEIQGISRQQAANALAALRARGLLDRRGNRFGLTTRGAEAATLFDGVVVPAGVGIVLTGHPIRK